MDDGSNVDSIQESSLIEVRSREDDKSESVMTTLDSSEETVIMSENMLIVAEVVTSCVGVIADNISLLQNELFVNDGVSINDVSGVS